MSGQYPPPNPAHPFSRAPHHQRGPPTPWGHSPQPSGMNMVGSSMNFYGSPHMGLPGRGTQSWAPPQTHPKPTDNPLTRPGSNNPLFGLQMLMNPEGNQRIPSEYQQEETMDLSSHSAVVPDPPKIVSAWSETSDVLRNGTILPPEVNGDVDRTTPAETEVKDSIVTSVIAANPLRESASEALSYSVVKRVETAVVPEASQVGGGVNSSSPVNTSEPVKSVESSVLKTNANSPESGEVTVADKSDETDAGKPEEETSAKLDIPSKALNSSQQDQEPPESQSSLMDSSSLSIDTDDSKLVVAESSADDIFGISPVVESAPSTSQETVKSEELSDKTPIPSQSDSWSARTVPTVVDSEPHPSVENVEILLENMFNSQEETSCSSQNSNSGVPQSVIVSNGARSADISRPALDLISPMKVEDLAMTLAEDTPLEPEVKAEDKVTEVKDNVNNDLMDEIEKKLEMLTEHGSTDPPIEPEVKAEPEPAAPAPTTEEADSEEPSQTTDDLTPAEEVKPVLAAVDPAPAVPQVEAGSSSNAFIEVETELEKMFAGIVEPTTDEVVSENQSQQSQPSVSSVSEPKRPVVNKRSITKRKKANSRRSSDNSVLGGSSRESTPVKKKGRKRLNDSAVERGSKKLKIDNADILKKGRALKDIASEGFSGKVKGPFVHIEGSKESPASVVIVNSGVRADDEDGTDKASVRRKHSTLQRTEASRRSGPAYSSSTLSMRYNSDTADLSWVCVFCKRGPHCVGGLGGEPAGDLFGPYRIPAMPPGDEAMPPGTPADRDVVDEQKKKGGKYAKSLRTSGGAEHFVQKMSKKSKRSLSTDSCEPQPGLLSVDGGYEVWLHGPCAEWAPGLCMIGAQLVGLDDAVWTALRMRCSQCGEAGAGIGCVVRNCPSRVHYHCAALCNWLLDTDTFIARCHVHRTRLRPS